MGKSILAACLFGCVFFPLLAIACEPRGQVEVESLATKDWMSFDVDLSSRSSPSVTCTEEGECVVCADVYVTDRRTKLACKKFNRRDLP